MEFKLERPDHEQPFHYTLNMDEEFLLRVMQGFDRVYASLDATLTEHSKCDRLSANGCLTDARSCVDVFVEVHGTMMTLAEFIKEARFVRENREAKSLETFRVLEAKAREVVATAARTMLPTSQFPTIGPVGSGSNEEVEGDGFETRTQKVDLITVDNMMKGIGCPRCGGLGGFHTVKDCRGKEPPLSGGAADSNVG